MCYNSIQHINTKYLKSIKLIYKSYIVVEQILKNIYNKEIIAYIYI